MLCGMSTIKRRFVLFADLRGSTALFESLGNAQATAIVTTVVRELACKVPEHGGQLVKTLGDGLMAIFPQSTHALACAMKMQEQLQQQRLLTHQSAAVMGAAPRLRLQIALSVGDVVEWGGDCFGDAVNVASRLLEHASDGEALITDDVFQALPWEGQVWFRPLDALQLRGRQEQVRVHVLNRAQGGMEVTVSHDAPPASAVRGLRLEFEDRELIFNCDDLPISLGRSSQCQVPIDNARVSRMHARIDHNGGTLELTDLSVNGTFVVFDGEHEIISLRRGFCTLHGHGSVGLGGPPDNPRASTFRFTVLMSAPESRLVGPTSAPPG